MNIERLLGFITAILIPLAVGGVVTLISRQNARETDRCRDGEGITIRMLPVMAIFGYFILIAGLFADVMFLLAKEKMDVLLPIVAMSGIFILAGLFLVLGQHFWCIRLPNGADHFLYRSYFGRTFTVYYRDCIGYKEPPTIGWPDVVAMVEDKHGQKKKKTFHVELFSVNLDAWIPALRAHGVEPLPQKAK